MATVAELQNNLEQLRYSRSFQPDGSPNAAYYDNLIVAAQAELDAAQSAAGTTYTHQQQVDFVAALYAGYYHRAPDTAGLNFWVGQLESGAKTRTQVQSAFASSPDMSPNAGQTLQAYLTAQGIAPASGYAFSADGNSIVAASTNNNGGTTPTTTEGGGILDTIGQTAENLPVVGSLITSLATSTGISSGLIAAGGLVVALYMLGVFDSGGGRRR